MCRRLNSAGDMAKTGRAFVCVDESCPNCHTQESGAKSRFDCPALCSATAKHSDRCVFTDPPTPTDWEEEFDEKFLAGEIPLTDRLFDSTAKKIKAFICSLLSAEREITANATEMAKAGWIGEGRTKASREEVTRLEGWLDDGRALGDIIKERLNYLKKG